MSNASYTSVGEITSKFCQLTLKSSKKQTLEWLWTNFPASTTRDHLIKFLSHSEHIVEDKFYHKDKECVIFYFQIYNCKTKRSCYKRISLCTKTMNKSNITKNCAFTCYSGTFAIVFHVYLGNNECFIIICYFYFGRNWVSGDYIGCV